MVEVYLFVYDLSNGLAAQISVQLTGRLFKAIHHTAIVIHGREYFFGGGGIESSLPGQSPYGSPIEQRLVGTCEVTLEAWQNFISRCASDYAVGSYHLLQHNCNTFSDAALQFLLNTRLDAEILSLPNDFLSTPLGVMLRPQIDAMYGIGNQAQANSADTRVEMPIDGPTSGNRADRVEEAYTYRNYPTLSKLFGEMDEPVRRLGNSEDERERLRQYTETLIARKPITAENLSFLHDFLLQYIREGSFATVYPGIDVIRMLISNEAFAQNLQAHSEDLIEVLFAKTFSEGDATEKAQILLLRLICNALVNIDLRPTIVTLLRKHDKLDMISSSPLSSSVKVIEAGLKTIWNILVLCDGIDDDFAMASLAAIAECDTMGNTELDSLKSRCIREITKGGSEAILEMVELLDLHE